MSAVKNFCLIQPLPRGPWHCPLLESNSCSVTYGRKEGPRNCSCIVFLLHHLFILFFWLVWFLLAVLICVLSEHFKTKRSVDTQSEFSQSKNCGCPKQKCKATPYFECHETAGHWEVAPPSPLLAAISIVTTLTGNCLFPSAGKERHKSRRCKERRAAWITVLRGSGKSKQVSQ